ncbi:MAG: hypothetical protein ACYSU7_05790 [Planctomycetota bacterium]
MSRVITVAVLLLLLAGCGKKASRQNDVLRARSLELEAQVRELTDRNRELEAALEQAPTDPETLPEDVRANIPHVVRVEIDRRSHALDEDGDGRADALCVYVKPSDGLGRFVQLVGYLGVHAAIVPGDADPISLGRTTLGPTEVREAYRTSFMGTHYRLTLPVTLPADLHEGSVTVTVLYTDGRSDRSVDDRHEIDLRP